MENSIYIGLSQQMALKRRMDITANNIANMSTTAFKNVHPLFEEYLVKDPKATDMSYVQDYGVYHDKTEGAIQQTGRPLDLAISGNGYFTIETDNGNRFTRNGNFKLDPDGFVVTQNGGYLLDEGGDRIQVSEEQPDIEIAPDGTVNLGIEETKKIDLVFFQNEQLLTQVGNGYYDAGNIRPRPSEDAKVLQGSLEQSNVQPILEMTAMVDILRTYQAAQKLLDAEHDMQMKSIEELPSIQ
ncbi:flagellar basal-body rod protein FlgF [Sneathiella sp.]|jgi:flagellar basal-body rod protein FlgF|uniref:flagellar basal-body rod protein FlgF n=1 Tax=Sneathiella sp. TaxID=1964365 RepID=UPI0039E336AA